MNVGRIVRALRNVKRVADPLIELYDLIADRVAEHRRQKKQAADAVRLTRDMAILDRLERERGERGNLR